MKKTTVTIGIPVYNEAQNIAHTLRSIVKQQCRTFTLETILVVCDGSTDGTPDIVHSFQKTCPFVSVIYHKARRGKAARLNELYQKNTSDYLFTLDGDIVLGTDTEIEKVLDTTRKTGAAVVAAHQIPQTVHGFIRRIVYANHMLWTEVRLQVNGGNYYQNLQGSATLLSREFAKRLRYPIGTVTDGEYLYVTAAREKTFALSRSSQVMYQPLGTLSDWIRLNKRLSSRNHWMKQQFGQTIQELYDPPLASKLKGIAIALKKDPLHAFLALATCYALKLIQRFQKPDITALWPTLTSTKKALTTNV